MELAARQRVDLIVVMTVQDPVGLRGHRAIRRIPRQHGPPALARQRLERLTEPEIVERLRARTEVRDAVDFCGVAHQAVHRPAQRLVRLRTGRHAVGGNDRLLPPQDQADLLADDRVDVADDRLRHEVAVEHRLWDPGRAVVGLVDEIEQRCPPLGLRAGIGRIPAVDEVSRVRLERRPQHVTRDVPRRGPGSARDEDSCRDERQHHAGDGADRPSVSRHHRYPTFCSALASLTHTSSSSPSQRRIACRYSSIA